MTGDVKTYTLKVVIILDVT